MSRSKRLQPLAQIADQKQQDAARLLKQSREELGRYEARLVELRSYRQEYVSRFQQAGNGGMGAGQMKDYLVFLGKLDEAVRQLDALILDTRLQCDSKKTDWMASRARFRALDEVITRHLKEERRDELRREQRQADEHTLRGVISRRRG